MTIQSPSSYRNLEELEEPAAPPATKCAGTSGQNKEASQGAVGKKNDWVEPKLYSTLNSSANCWKLVVWGPLVVWDSVIGYPSS